MSVSLLTALLLSPPLDGVTVFAGDKPEPFQAIVLDTLPHALGPRAPLILARLKGAKIEHTGVIAGMSGSPVYRDGQLIGAVGYRFGSFSKEPIAGITPIDMMRDTLKGLPQATQRAANLETVQVPLVVAGLDADISQTLLRRLSAVSAAPLRAVAGGGFSSGATPSQLVNGGAIAVVMAKGDINLFGLGTVTEVRDDTFIGFGHPMFGWGAVNIPVATATVSTTIASPENAFKIGRLGRVVGAMTQDRLPAIAGKLGPPPAMIPVRVDVGEAKPIEVDVAIHRRLTPSLLASVTQQALRRRLGFEAGGTLGLTGTLETEAGNVRIDEWVAHPHHPGTSGAVAQTLYWMSELLLDNPLGGVAIRQVELKLHRAATTHVESLRSLEVLNPTPRSGDPLDLRLRWRRYQQPDRLQSVSLPLDTSLSPGTLQVIVAAGSAVDAVERHCGDGAPPRTLNQLIPWLNARASARQRAIYVVRSMATQSFGTRRMVRARWDDRLPKVDLDAEPGNCLIVARHRLDEAAGPVVANEVYSIELQGAP